MSNVNYSGINGSGAGKNLGLAVESLLSKDKIVLAARSRYPLLSVLLDGDTNMNTSSEGAPKYLLPVSFGTGPGSGTATILQGGTNGVTGTAFTPAANMTVIPLSFNDPTMAEEREALYRTGFGLTYQEEVLLEKGSTQKRVSVIKNRATEIQDWFLKRLAADVVTSTNASETKIMGLSWALATANTVHGIDQATVANWRSGVAAIGAWTIADLDESIRLAIQDRDSNIDYVVFSTSAGSNNNWQKMMTFYRNATVIQDHKATAKMGSAVYMWNNTRLMYDQFMPNNEVYFLDSSKLFWNGDSSPKPYQSGDIIDTTTVKAYTYVWRACLMLYPQFHRRWTGATA